jgi:hypothetical protein
MTLVTSISELKRELEITKGDLVVAQAAGDADQIAALESTLKERAAEIADLETEFEDDFVPQERHSTNRRGSRRTKDEE